MASADRFRPVAFAIIAAGLAASPAVGSAAAQDVAPPVARPPDLRPPPPPLTAPGRGDLDQGAADIFREFGHGFGTVTPGGGARAAGAPRGGGDGGYVIGPGGVLAPDAVRPSRRAERKAPPKPTPEQRQAEIRRTLVPRVPYAQTRRKTLDELYGKLAAADDDKEAQRVAAVIAAVWQRSPSDTANLLMSRADAAVAARDYPGALRVLDRLVALRPEWAEAWNRRATARFLAGDLDSSMADVEHVLKLEPKHFAALNGLAMILQRTGFDKQALQVYRRAEAIYPRQPGLRETIDKLALAVEGQGI